MGKAKQGGSAIKRLKESLKTAGIIGPQAKARRVSKNRSKKDQVAAQSARKDAKTALRTMAAAGREANPFEMKFARPKHEVIGRKVKGVTGRPGLTKKKSEDIRKKTLLVEMKNKTRESALVDRRIGEHDPSMSLEDKMLERFMREKTKRASGGAAFNLEDDDEELTHMGQSLSKFDAFDDAGLERVEDSDEDGNIDAKIVKYTHFGGFEEDGADPDAKKSRNEIMKEVIAKSKMHKRERQKQKEEDIELQNEIDADLEEIRGMLAPMSEKPTSRALSVPLPASEGKMVISNERAMLISGEIAVRPSEVAAPHKSRDDEDEVVFNPPPRPVLDQDYDKFLRELAYDRRAKPTDRIKTEEEIALAERAKLEKLEKERLRRMKGEEPDDGAKSAKKRESKKRPAQADDLGDDDYDTHVTKTIEMEEEMPLTYKDGKLVNDKIFMTRRIDKRDDDDDDDNDDDDDEDEDEDDDEGDDDDDDEDDDDEEDGDDADEENGVRSRKAQAKIAEVRSRARGDREGSLEPEFDDDDEGSENGLAAAAYESYSEDDAEGNDDGSDEGDSSDNGDGDSASSQDSDSEAAADKRQAADVDGGNYDDDEIPYVIDAPETLDDLLSIIKGKTVEARQTIIKRLRILNNARLGPEYKERLQQLSLLLLEYRDHVLSQSPPDVVALKALEGHTVELGRQFSAQTAEFCLERIVSIQETLIKSMAGGAKRKAFMSLEDLYFFRVVGEIFSASDLQHVVVTPALLVMSQVLAQCPVASGFDAAAGLFLCEILYDYVSVSKRFSPELVVFLHRLLASCLGIESPQPATMIPLPSMIYPQLAIRDYAAEPFVFRLSLLPGLAKPRALTESVKVALLTQSLHLLSRCARLWNELGCNIELFSPTLELTKHLSLDTLTEQAKEMVQKALEGIKAQMTSAALKRRPLQLQRRKAIPIATFVPKFQENYSHDRRYDPDRDRAEAAKVRAQFKKEQKGATRELRKDAAFIARQQLEDKRAQDAEYKKKMDRIMGQLASQEGAMRGVERAAKKSRKR
ncbi:nucleolar complex protein 14 [Polyrhizophydium stewartii]|uniref:Nucleolar complex protein 14 n=1 Tax=Polyrhizophydium stewartii TaxID=2732419 RepID=A0ABR4NAA0_9FUNG